MADIEGKVKEIIMNKLGVEASQITPTASFTNDWSRFSGYGGTGHGI